MYCHPLEMASRSRRPEHSGPPELFYDQNEARKYVRNSRMIDIQTKMTERALELLCLPEGQPSYLLDVGCGSGLSGDYISEEGHYWVGIDISPAMLGKCMCPALDQGHFLFCVEQVDWIFACLR